MILIDGKKVAAEIKEEIAASVSEFKAKGGKTPHLAAVLVGHDGGSETYVAYKIKDCEAVGFKSSLIRYEDNVTETELLAKVQELNEDADIDGFIVQLPLPGHISEQKVIEAIDPKKDVDGFHPENVGRMVIGLPSFVSATPFGIVELLKRYNIERQEQHRGQAAEYPHVAKVNQCNGDRSSQPDKGSGGALRHSRHSGGRTGFSWFCEGPHGEGRCSGHRCGNHPGEIGPNQIGLEIERRCAV